MRPWKSRNENLDFKGYFDILVFKANSYTTLFKPGF